MTIYESYDTQRIIHKNQKYGTRNGSKTTKKQLTVAIKEDSTSIDDIVAALTKAGIEIEITGENTIIIK